MSAADLRADLSAEANLLLCCARLDLSEALRARLDNLVRQDGLDWKRLLALAKPHGLMPLLYRHLGSLGEGVIPKKVFAELWARYAWNSCRNRALAKALTEICNALDAAGIPAVPYKGPALAADVYADLGLREFGDLDLLVSPAHVRKAIEVLNACGYHSEYRLHPVSEAAQVQSRSQYHLALEHDCESVVVELHWKTDVDFPVEHANDALWWSNLPSTPFEGGWIRSFRSEELLLIMLLHGAKHGWCSLGWLVDVGEFVRRYPNMNWDWIAGEAGRLGCKERAFVGLSLAIQLLDSQFPERIEMSLARMPRIRFLSRKIINELFSGKPRQGEGLGLYMDMILFDRWGQRVAHLVRVVFAPTPAEWGRWSLSGRWRLAYVALRMYRLIVKHSLGKWL